MDKVITYALVSRGKIDLYWGSCSSVQKQLFKSSLCIQNIIFKMNIHLKKKKKKSWLLSGVYNGCGSLVICFVSAFFSKVHGYDVNTVGQKIICFLSKDYCCFRQFIRHWYSHLLAVLCAISIFQFQFPTKCYPFSSSSFKLKNVGRVTVPSLAPFFALIYISPPLPPRPFISYCVHRNAEPLFCVNFCEIICRFI